ATERRQFPAARQTHDPFFCTHYDTIVLTSEAQHVVCSFTEFEWCAFVIVLILLRHALIPICPSLVLTEAIVSIVFNHRVIITIGAMQSAYQGFIFNANDTVRQSAQ